MSESADKLPSLFRIHRAFRRRYALEAACLFAALALGAFALILFLSHFADSGALRLGLLILFFSFSAALIGLLYKGFKKNASVPAFCLWLEKKSPGLRDVLSAFEFSRLGTREGVSAELAESVVSSVEEKLKRERVESHFSPEALRRPLMSLGMVVLVLGASAVFPPYLFQSGWTRLLHGLDREIARYLKVSPEGGKVPMGQAVDVSVRLITPKTSVPRLLIEGPSGWDEVPGSGGPFDYKFGLGAVIEPTAFKVVWENLETRAFLLTPVEAPRLSEFAVTLIPPAYTQEKPATFKAEPQIHAYRGTQAEITAGATQDLFAIELVTEDGRRYPVELSGNRNVKAAFTVQNPFNFSFDMKDKEGMAGQRVLYSVTVKEDETPRIEILAPSEDLVAGQEARLPFTFEIKDDLGVKAVFLNIEQQSGGRGRVTLKSYEANLKHKIDEASFSLGSLRTNPGEIIRLRLEAQDNDIVTGPKSGFSDWLTVEIRSYEKEHLALEKDLENFRKDLLELLSEQTEASVTRKQWEELSKDPAALPPKISETARLQDKAAKTASKMESELASILEKMERDPLSDFSSWSEHRALKDGLKEVREGSMERAKAALEKKELAQSALAQEEALSQIERLSHLSEEIHKYGKMRDLLHAADRLEEKGQRLAQKLADGKDAARDALASEISEIMKEAFKILSEIDKAIKDLPQELPEDFVNKPAVKDMKLNDMVDSLGQIAESMQKGDLKSALEAAQNLLKQAKAARETLAKAAEETLGKSDGAFGSAQEESENDLDKVVSKQEELLGKTYPFEAKRKEKLLQMQKKILEELAGKQRDAILAAQALSKDISAKSPRIPYQDAMLANLTVALPKMEKVLKELAEKNVIFSQKWLEEIQQSLDAGLKVQEAYYKENQSTSAPQGLLQELEESSRLAKSEGAILNTEKEILEALKNPPKDAPGAFSKDEGDSMKSLGGQQEKLAGETGKIAGELRKIGERSALVKPELLESVKGAEKEMKASKDSLEAGESEKAVQAQEKALSHLRRGQEMMGEMGESMGMRKESRGQKNSMVQQRGKAGGRSGFRHGIVRIPGPEEYTPPKEFREEILESLKEKYPKSEENVIKDYFKRLTQ